MTNSPYYFIRKPEDIQASYDVAIAENPANRGVSVTARKKRATGKHTNFWAPGRTLRIAFLNGDQSFKDAVKAAASNWLPYVNLKFDFVEGEVGDIRIKSEPGVYWSYIGTNALIETDQSLPTMRLSPDHHLSLKFFIANAMHEFGHMLGAEHEHLHPESNIPWNRRAVYAAHGVDEDADEDDYVRRSVDERYFNLLDASEVVYSPYDPQSIMHYPVHQEWTEGNFKIDLNLVLSQKDKAFMAEIYPFPTTF
ncbi:zinc metalloprotease [Pseudomonas sp. LB3P81]